MVQFVAFVVRLQPILSQIKDFGMTTVSEHERKVACRQWSVASEYLREAIDKMVMVAHDEGQMTNESFNLFCTSCMIRHDIK